MKRTVVTLLSLTWLFTAQAQQSGTVTYTETIRMDLPGSDENEEHRALMARLPKEQKIERVLYFTPEASLFKNKKEKKKEESQEYEEGGARVMIKMDVPDEQYYLDIAGKTMVEQRDFMGRKFLIDSKADGSKWRLTGKQDKILNYPCQEAVMQDGKKKITAWFTPAIPVGTGPHGYNSLPGLILKLVVNDGQVVMEASNVELKTVPAGEIKKPKEGKKMTEQEFAAMVEERMKEMGADGGGNMIIKVRR